MAFTYFGGNTEQHQTTTSLISALRDRLFLCFGVRSTIYIHTLVVMHILSTYLEWVQRLSFYSSSPVVLTRYWMYVIYETECPKDDVSRQYVFRWPRTIMRLSVGNVYTDADYARRYMPFFAGGLRVDPFWLDDEPVSVPFNPSKALALPSTVKRSLNYCRDRKDNQDDLDVLVRVCGSFSCVPMVIINVYSTGYDTENDQPLDLSGLLGPSVRRVVIKNRHVPTSTRGSGNDGYARTNMIFSGDHACLRSIHFVGAQTVTPKYHRTTQPHFIRPILSDGSSRPPLCVSSSILSCANELKGFRNMVKRLKESGVRMDKLFITLKVDALDNEGVYARLRISLPVLNGLKEVHFKFWRNSHWQKPESHPVVQDLIAGNQGVRLLVPKKRRRR